jgi:hypothetical protein
MMSGFLRQGSTRKSFCRISTSLNERQKIAAKSLTTRRDGRLKTFYSGVYQITEELAA